MYRTLAVVLFGLSLLIQSHVVSADAIPYATTLTHSGRLPEFLVFDLPFPVPLGGHATPEDACRAAVAGHASIRPAAPGAPRYSSTYHHITRSRGYVGGGCYWINNTDGQVYGYDITPNPPYGTLGWVRDLACPRGGLPGDPEAAQPMCVCPPGMDFPLVPRWPGGPYCVLGGGCPVTVTQGTWVSLDAEETKIYFSAVPRDDGSIYLPVFAGGHLEGVVRCTTDCPKSERDIKLPPLAAPDLQVGNDTVSLEMYLDGWVDNFEGYYGRRWRNQDEIKALIEQWRATDPTYFCR